MDVSVERFGSPPSSEKPHVGFVRHYSVAASKHANGKQPSAPFGADNDRLQRSWSRSMARTVTTNSHLFSFFLPFFLSFFLLSCVLGAVCEARKQDWSGWLVGWCLVAAVAS